MSDTLHSSNAQKVAKLLNPLAHILLLDYLVPKQVAQPQTAEVFEPLQPRRCEGTYRPGGDVTGQDDLPCGSGRDVRFVGGDVQEYWCVDCRHNYREGEFEGVR